MRAFGERDGYSFEAGGAIDACELGWAYRLYNSSVNIDTYRLTPTAYGISFERRITPLSAARALEIAENLAAHIRTKEGVEVTLIQHE